MDDSWLWHKRLCHINFDNIVKISNVKAVRDLPSIARLADTICRECVVGKHVRSSFKSKKNSTENKLDLVHTYLCGPTQTRSYYGERYFILFVYDFSRMMWVAFLKEKYEAFETFKIFKAKVENEFGLKLKCLRSDRGGEFTSDQFYDYYEEHGIKRQLSAPRTPQKNRIAERRSRIILDTVCTMMIEGKVVHTYWRDAVNTAVYTINRTQLRPGVDKTPYELWFGNVPTVKYFRIFGRNCYIKRDDGVGKFDSRIDEGIFLGYSTKRKAYRCFNLRLKKIIESTHVKIDEKFMVQERYYEYAPMIEDEPRSSSKDTVIEEMFDCIDVSCNEPESSKEESQIIDDDVTPKVSKFTSRYHSKEDIIGD